MKEKKKNKNDPNDQAAFKIQKAWRFFQFKKKIKGSTYFYLQ
jgi:hypothetical protein